MDLLTSLLALLAGLGGVAALIAVLVNIGKVVGIVTEVTTPDWVFGLNFVAFVALAVLHYFPVIAIPLIDANAAKLAQLLVYILSFFAMPVVSAVAHYGLRGTWVAGASFSFKRANKSARGMPKGA